jgi:hypothetical protein
VLQSGQSNKIRRCEILSNAQLFILWNLHPAIRHKFAHAKSDAVGRIANGAPIFPTKLFARPRKVLRRYRNRLAQQSDSESSNDLNMSFRYVRRSGRHWSNGELWSMPGQSPLKGAGQYRFSEFRRGLKIVSPVALGGDGQYI